jgi:predicted ester cyclase
MEMSTRRTNKTAVWDFIHALDRAPVSKVESTLKVYCAEDIVWEVFHPFNTLRGCRQAAHDFWGSIMGAIPDLERRLDIFAGDVYNGEYWVTCMGYVCGTFENSWLDIPPTGKVVYLRIGEFYKVDDGKIVKAHVLLDIPDVMRQAGVYPFRPMLGTPGLVLGPKNHNGLRLGDDDLEQKTLETVLSMHKALHDYDGRDLSSMQHSHCWSEHFLYYAPAGIGTTRGMDSFKQNHQKPFLDSFPDRHGREHYVRISDGPIACTSHWGTLTATHKGSQWLGLPATGKKISMRVADWYCADDEGFLHENWLMMDIPDIYRQMGFDLFEKG